MFQNLIFLKLLLHPDHGHYIMGTRQTAARNEKIYGQKNKLYQHCGINFFNHFKCYSGIKTGIPAKTNCCTLFNCFFHYDVWHGQNRQVTSHRKYVPHYEQFELNLACMEKRVYWWTFPSFVEIALLVLYFRSIIAQLTR